MHVTISSLILSILWSECKNRHEFLRSCLGFYLNFLIRFKCVRLTDKQFPKHPLRLVTDQFPYP